MRKELRETLRDRRTLAVMILFPLVVYPLVSLLLTEVIAGKQTAGEARASRVAIVTTAGTSADPVALAQVRAVLGVKGSGITLAAPTTTGPVPSAPPLSEIGADRLDAIIQLSAAASPGVAARVRVYFDETRETSEKAHERVEALLSAVLAPGCTRTYQVVASSIAPKSKIGGYVLSKILPLIVVVMTMLGAFYPAIDITAGERERGTLETLLSSPVRRFDLMTGKVLAVTALATLTGVLNIASMSLTVAEGAKLAGAGQALTIPWARTAATLLTVVPAAFLFGAVMVAIGAMARGFKEAQTLLTPVYLLCFTPSVIASTADLRLAGLALLIPGTNLTLLARDLMLGQARLGGAAIVVGSTLFYGAIALSFAARLYDSERLLASTDAELAGLGPWIRHLLGWDKTGGAGSVTTPSASPKAEPSPGDAIGLFGVAFVLWFFVFTWLQRWRLIPGLLLSQWGGFLGLVWIYGRLNHRRLREVLHVRRPNLWTVAGATMLGLSGWVILGALADRVLPPPAHLIEEMRKLIRPADGERPLIVSLFALALTPAICEESLFRGPILRGFQGRFSAPAACLLTGVLFGILHGDIWRFVPTSLLGALLSWVALSSGSIVPSMLIHFINNGALVALGYYGLDRAAEKLTATAQFAILASALGMFGAGIASVRRGRRAQAENQTSQTS
jgi:sodium transport system permease protein